MDEPSQRRSTKTENLFRLVIGDRSFWRNVGSDIRRLHGLEIMANAERGTSRPTTD
jgi:hypothetical protein